MKGKKERTCLHIDMSIPTEKNTSLKTMKKLTEYKDLAIEIKKMWVMKTATVPVVIGVFGLVKKGTENYIGKIPDKIKVTELQKTVLPGTAHCPYTPSSNPADLPYIPSEPAVRAPVNT